MRQVATAWQAEAIAGEQANVEELGRRIDQFVRFRTELVRLGKEESTAAARLWGDNDANRNVRTALNQSLSALARAYEQEIGRAREVVEADQRSFFASLAGLTSIAVIALSGGLMVVHRSLLAAPQGPDAATGRGRSQWPARTP